MIIFAARKNITNSGSAGVLARNMLTVTKQQYEKVIFLTY